tara:strand:- start:762 stop:1007 length:246 start_codon:yes stop_codon:yes gene_type:complete
MNKLNWPKVTLIITIIFAGGFVIYADLTDMWNKPKPALSSGNTIVSVDLETENVWQLKNGKVRICAGVNVSQKPICSPWSD